ncbi:hypothetical protein DCAR_0520475 [Daucus carota subsp. sativus]|uniref:Uncharacterized protein n=1 Tax=Daucus carota subsp. sativus TaxID=79200 RepID=A0A161XSH1_DAUCS|nr:PREDICTED: protein transport protein SEC7-like [Daucus carota subsp. sativus]WOH01096.1 hypothetical protein DCAR_0520475 [Daucus carota subsp. sativus]
MSDSNFSADVKEDHDNKDHGDQDSDQQPLDLRKENGEFVDDKKDEGSANTTLTAEEDLEKKPRQSGEEGRDSTEEDENDGFRTPTSIEHRIPVPTHCPPAPRKSLKRKFEDSSITEILRSARKVIQDHIMVFRKAREDDEALS